MPEGPRKITDKTNAVCRLPEEAHPYAATESAEGLRKKVRNLGQSS